MSKCVASPIHDMWKWATVHVTSEWRCTRRHWRSVLKVSTPEFRDQEMEFTFGSHFFKLLELALTFRSLASCVSMRGRQVSRLRNRFQSGCGRFLTQAWKTMNATDSHPSFEVKPERPHGCNTIAWTTVAQFAQTSYPLT